MPIRPLEREADLIEHLVRLTPVWLGRPRTEWTAEREVAVGRSIADLVVYLYGRGTPSFVEPLSVKESVVLAMLRQRGPTRIDILERRCGLPRQALRQGALERLLDHRLIRLTSGGRIEAHASISASSRLLAIEGKLIKWRPALRQAREYRRYADRSYVALPADVLARNSIDLAEFRNAGVGVLGVSPRTVREVIPAALARRHDWRREFVLSRMISRVWTHDAD